MILRVDQNLAFFVATLGFLSLPSQAELVLLPDPTTSTASSFHSAPYVASNLYDASPTISDIDSNFNAGNSKQFAGLGAGPHVLVFDYGAAITFSGIAYSQRLGGDPILDKVQNIDVWVSDTDPGAATVALPDTLGAAQGNTGQLNTGAGLTTFSNYDLGIELAGRYVIFRFNDAGGTVGNPGGSELQLTFDTGPADPDLIAPAVFDFGRLQAGSAAVTEQFEISNIGVGETLVISGITLEGPDAGSFSIVSSPTTLAPGATGSIVVTLTPGATPDILNATAVIASSDANSANTHVSLIAKLTTPIPDDLVFLADPSAISASTFFNGSYAPEFLYDADPTVDDFEDPEFDPSGQYAGTGEGPHVLVLDFGESVNFNGVAFSQRLGTIIDADKVPGFEFWASNSDPGTASLDLPILSTPPEAMTDLVTTDTSPLLRYYPLETTLTGRYVVIRLAMGTYNPGGSELQLTMSGSPQPFQIQSIVYPGGTSVTITWNSRPLKRYTIERSTDMQGVWEELNNNVLSEGESTTFTDGSITLDTARMFYRVIQN